ncbi:MAG: hypothetical protein AB7D57_04270 [Desulfovibrionaceae bacterium]
MKIITKLVSLCSVAAALVGLSVGSSAAVTHPTHPTIAHVDASTPLYLDQAKAAVQQQTPGNLAGHSSHYSHSSHVSHSSHYSHRSGY